MANPVRRARVSQVAQSQRPITNVHVTVVSVKATGGKRQGDNAPQYDVKVKVEGIKPGADFAQLQSRVKKHPDIDESGRVPIQVRQTPAKYPYDLSADITFRGVYLSSDNSAKYLIVFYNNQRDVMDVSTPWLFAIKRPGSH